MSKFRKTFKKTFIMPSITLFAYVKLLSKTGILFWIKIEKIPLLGKELFLSTDTINHASSMVPPSPLSSKKQWFHWLVNWFFRGEWRNDHLIKNLSSQGAWFHQRHRKKQGWKIKNNNKQTENSVAIGPSYCSDFSSLCFKVFLISSLFIYRGR